jgi:hypothetical protein
LRCRLRSPAIDIDQHGIGPRRFDRLAQIGGVVRGAGAKGADRARLRFERRAGAIVLERQALDRSRDRRRLEAALAQHRDLFGERLHCDVMAAALERVENRHDREEMAARRRGVGENSGHALTPSAAGEAR